MFESLGVAIQVLADWRVIAVTLGMIAVWALLRHVGLVYRRPKPPKSRKAARPTATPAAPARPAAQAEGEEMVE